MPESRIEGFLAAGHAATITGWGVFEAFVERHQVPVVVAGFEPLDILAGAGAAGRADPRRHAASREHVPALRDARRQPRAQEQLWRVFAPIGGRWRGIAHVPNGNLRLRDELAHVDARRRFAIDLTRCGTTRRRRSSQQCICGDIMAGTASRRATAALFGRECVPDKPVGACMVSSEGTCKIWHQYGGVPICEARACAHDGARRPARITLKHGAGGRAMRALIEQVFLRDAAMPRPARLGRWTTARRFRSATAGWSITTDSHVIHPIFFPGGDIGRLAVCRHGQRPGDDGRDRAARPDLRA